MHGSSAQISPLDPLLAGHTAAPEPRVRMDVHDRSRIEWVVTVPIAPVGEAHTWEVLLQAQIPEAMWVPHQPWDHFTVRSRLTSPSLEAGERQLGDGMDCVRRRALAVSHLLKVEAVGLLQTLATARRRPGHARHLLPDQEARVMVQRLAAVYGEACRQRDRLQTLALPGDLALQREVHLADEYISNHVLVLVTKVTRMLDVRHRLHRPPLPAMHGGADDVRTALAEMLRAETLHRKQHEMRHAAVTNRQDIEALVNRAALLKKHFQQALFLEAKAYMVDERLRNWIAAIVAMIASSFYFVWQVWVLNAAMTTAQTTVSLVLAGMVAALVYAAKDRIKEVGRDWLARRVKDRVADRVAHLRLQARMDPKQSHFALARETISLKRVLQADPLNPGLGQTQVVHQLSVLERLRHIGLPILHEQGMNGLKHVLRYDLSPLLVKLDDHRKRVPVLTEHDGKPARVQVRSALRVYSIAVTVHLRQVGLPTGQGVEYVVRGVLQLQRGGLVRFVPAPDARARHVALGAGHDPRHKGVKAPSSWPASLSSGQFPPVAAR